MKFLTTLLAVSLLVTTPALADSVQAQVDFVNADSFNAKVYKAEYVKPVFANIAIGGEVSLAQVDNQKDVSGALVASARYTGLTVFKTNIVPYVEVGTGLTNLGNDEFYGAGVTASRSIYGPISAEVGFRYRDGFDISVDQTRASVGINYSFKNTTLGAVYYATNDSDTVGIRIKQTY